MHTTKTFISVLIKISPQNVAHSYLFTFYFQQNHTAIKSRTTVSKNLLWCKVKPVVCFHTSDLPGITERTIGFPASRQNFIKVSRIWYNHGNSCQNERHGHRGKKPLPGT